MNEASRRSSPDPAPREGRFVVANRAADLAHAQQSVLEIVERVLGERAALFAIRLALEEAVSNASRHGAAGDPGAVITLDYRIAPGEVHIEVQDDGPGFDPLAVPDPTAEENLEIPSGRGLMLMRAYMTEVSYNETGNRVRLRYVWNAE